MTKMKPKMKPKMKMKMKRKRKRKGKGKGKRKGKKKVKKMQPKGKRVMTAQKRMMSIRSVHLSCCLSCLQACGAI